MKDDYKVKRLFEKKIPKELKGIIADIDNNDRKIDLTVGQMLENMLLKDVGGNYIGVFPGMQDYGDIFKNGIPLVANGAERMSEGSSAPHIDGTIGLKDQLWQVFHGIKHTSQNVYIVVIPKAYLEEKAKPILFYNEEDKRYYLLPEFVKCWLPKDEKGETARLITNPNYRAVHDYQNEGLAYDTSYVSSHVAASATPAPTVKKPSLWQRVIASKPFKKPEDHDDHDDQHGPDQSNGGNVVRFK